MYDQYENKIDRRSTKLRIFAIILFCIALTLLVIMRLFESQKFIEWYNKYSEVLENVKAWVENFGQTPVAVIIILLNYVLKAFVPWFPITFIMFLSGMLFRWYIAVPISTIGITMLFTIKFYWGKKMGGGNAEKWLSSFDKAHTFIEEGKLGSSFALFVARLLPLMPINSVSQLYGTTDISFIKYIIVSLLGFSYKLVSYTIIARNIYNPLSFGFFVPIIVLILLTGLISLCAASLLTATSPFIKKFTEKHKLKNHPEDKDE